MSDELAALVKSVRRELPPIVDRTPLGDNIESLCAAVEALSSDVEGHDSLSVFVTRDEWDAFLGEKTVRLNVSSSPRYLSYGLSEAYGVQRLQLRTAIDAARSPIPGPLNV